MIDDSPIREEKSYISEVSDKTLYSKTFFWMFLGLLGTAVTAWYTYSSNIMENLIMSGGYWGVVIAELVVVILFSFCFRKLSPGMVTVLFFLYSMINGLSLSTIFIAFDLGTIFKAFLATSLIFGVLAFVGKKTEIDISKWGNILFAMLVVGLILTIINLFIGSTGFEIMLNWIMLAVFFGLIIYDMATIRALKESGEFEEDKIAIYCAMQLYLDFINIFLRLLRLFAKRND